MDNCYCSKACKQQHRNKKVHRQSKPININQYIYFYLITTSIYIFSIFPNQIRSYIDRFRKRKHRASTSVGDRQGIYTDVFISMDQNKCPHRSAVNPFFNEVSGSIPSFVFLFGRALKYIPQLFFCSYKFIYISTHVCYSSYQNRNGKYMFLFYLPCCYQNQVPILPSLILAFLNALKISSRSPFLQLQVYVYQHLHMIFIISKKKW